MTTRRRTTMTTTGLTTSEFNPQLKLLAHPGEVQAFLRGYWGNPPVQVEISPTNYCNAKCPWCFYVSSEYKQHHSKEELPRHTILELIVDLTGSGVEAITWTGGGDPSVYSHLDEATDVANSHGLKQGIFTNG